MPSTGLPVLNAAEQFYGVLRIFLVRAMAMGLYRNLKHFFPYTFAINLWHADRLHTKLPRMPITLVKILSFPCNMYTSAIDDPYHTFQETIGIMNGMHGKTYS
jgi:hypothetical protein